MQTTILSNRSRRPSCWHAFTRCSAALRSRPKTKRWPTPISGSILRRAKQSAATARFSLTAKEYDLLHYLLRNPRQVLRREQILQEVWGYDFGGEDNVLEVYIGYLRKKTEAGGEPRLIQTVRGVGYVLREDA